MKEDYNQYQRGALMMTVFTAFLTTFVSSGLNLSIPGIETEFATNAVTVGWVITGYTMGSAVFSVPIGKIADAVGRKKVLVIGLTSFLILSLVCTMTRSIGMLITIRVLHGIAAACLFATNNAILISVFPGSKRGQVLGVSVGATYTGLSLGPVIGGMLNSHFGWRSILIVTSVIAAISLFFAVTGCPNDKPDKSEYKPDYAGNLVYMAMIASFLYGFSVLIGGMTGKVLVVVSVVLAFIFAGVEIRTKNPVIKVTMFTQDIVFTLSNIAALLNYAATFAVTYLISIYLQVIMGFSSQAAGLILIAMPIIQAVLAPRMGKLSDRVAPYKLATAGMGFCVIGLGMFAFLSVNTRMFYVVVGLMIMGLGISLFSSPNTNAIMGRVSKEDYAVANSIVSTMRTVGQSFSMAVVNVVVALRLGERALSDATPAELVGTMRMCFIICVVMCAVGTFISLKRAED